VLSSPIIDLAIGLVFVFGVTAALASLLTELIARFLGLRGAYLLAGLRELVDDGAVPADLTNVQKNYTDMKQLITDHAKAAASGAPAASDAAAEPKPSAMAALLGGPILRNQGVAGQLSTRNLTLETKKAANDKSLPKITRALSPAVWSQLRSLPAYISSRSFADAVIDLVVPNTKGETTMKTIEDNIQALPDSFHASLGALVKNADDDVTKFRTGVEQWYDDHMDRVSGWYKRHTAWITIAVGVIVVVLLNLNALSIGRTLYTENAVSAAVSSVAAKTTTCSSADPSCLSTLDSDLSAAAASGLPVGWGTVRACTQKGVACGWWERRGILSPFGGDGAQAAQVLLVLAGFLIMIFALLPGAQFWFGLLSKLGTLRSTGPKPAPAASTAISLTVSPPLAGPVSPGGGPPTGGNM
jgi:hypothetical protein